MNPVHWHCGPWNSVDAKAPSNKVDKVCWEHDQEEEYNRWFAIMRENPKADRRFVKAMEDIPGFAPKFYSATFKVKEKMWRWGRRAAALWGSSMAAQYKYTRDYKSFKDLPDNQRPKRKQPGGYRPLPRSKYYKSGPMRPNFTYKKTTQDWLNDPKTNRKFKRSRISGGLYRGKKRIHRKSMWVVRAGNKRSKNKSYYK